MKKKILSFLLIALVSLNQMQVFADEKDEKIANLENQIKILEEEIELLKEQLEKYETNNQYDMEQYLIDSGVISGERIEMAAEMVGAISGFKYGNVEIYEYDTNSNEYKSLVENNSIELIGMPGVVLTPTSINEEYVLFGTVDETTIEAFERYE